MMDEDIDICRLALGNAAGHPGADGVVTPKDVTDAD
jgi:hypothetical protein